MVTVRFIKNPFRLAQNEVKEVDGRTVIDCLKAAGVDHDGIRVIVSGKRISDLDYPVEAGDEIIVTPDVKGPVIAVISAIVSAVWAAAVAHPFIAAFFILSTGYSIYSAVSQPRMPDFNLGANSGGIDEGSPTYGWDGVQTVQEVGVPVPIIYGEHKVGGNIINQFIWTNGDKNYLNLLLALCEGEIEDITDVKINDNPVTNFNNVEVFKRMGTNDQAVAANFEDLHSLNLINANLMKDTPYLYTTVDHDVEAFELQLRFNNGLFLQNQDNGDIQTWAVTYKVECRVHGTSTWTDLGSTTVSEKSRTVLRRVFRKEGLNANQYDIRVTRTSDNSDFYHTGDSTLYQVDEIKTDDLKYPNTALLGLKLLATDQLSGSTPNVSVIVKGRKVRIPDIRKTGNPVNWEDYYWDPSASQYKLFSDNSVLTWDGINYLTAYCANPVWCLRDLLLSGRYGLGEFISATNLDDASLLEMSRYCEEKLSDGNGGYEKRFHLDIVLDSNTKALDALIQVCATFNAMPVYSAGGITFKIDKPALPTQLFGMGNIVKDTFVQSWKTIKETPNVIEIQFNDRAKNYDPETIAYIDEAALSSGDPMRKQQLRVFTTRTSYALRAARYALKVAKYINRTISFKAGIDAVACQAGDVISISHDVTQWGFSGRVQAGSTASLIKLDRTVTIESGKTYKLQVRFSDDTLEEKTVTNAPGTYSQLNVNSAFSQTPQGYEVYAFGETGKVKKDFRITQIQRAEDNEVTISALEYDANVYDDSSIDLPTNNYSALVLGIPNVTTLSLTERILKLADGTIENVIDVWFDRPDEADYYINQYAKAKIYLSDNNGTSWQYRGETYGVHFAVQGNISDLNTYKVAVVSVSTSRMENSVTASPSASMTVQGKTAPPSNVVGFSCAFARDHIAFSWEKVEDVDLKGYEIRALPFAGAGWYLGTVIDTNIVGTSYDLFNLSAGQKNYAIKAIDTSGNYSQNEATDSLFISDIPDINVIKTSDFDLRQGTLNGYGERCWVKGYDDAFWRIGLALMTNKKWDDGCHWDAAGIEWDKAQTINSAEYITDTVDLGSSFDVGVTLDIGLANSSGGKLLIQAAFSDTNSTPTNWTNFVSGNFTGRYFRFKFTFSSLDGDAGVEIYKIKASFDVPDLVVEGKNVAISVSGSTINLSGFTQVQTLIVSSVGSAYVPEINQSALPVSFNVKLRDPADSMNLKTGSINYYVKGY